MSFGLGISFGRLCKPKRTLDDVYAEARRIEGWDLEGNTWLKTEWDFNRKRIVIHGPPLPRSWIYITGIES